MHTMFLSEDLKGKDQSEDLGVGELILEWILKAQVSKLWTR